MGSVVARVGRKKRADLAAQVCSCGRLVDLVECLVDCAARVPCHVSAERIVVSRRGDARARALLIAALKDLTHENIKENEKETKASGRGNVCGPCLAIIEWWFGL